MALPSLSALFNKFLGKKSSNELDISDLDKKDLTRIFDRYRYDVSIVQKSRDWFNKQTNILSRVRINERQLFREQKVVSNIRPGRMYCFYYDPKHKDTLPYYDRFPLVLPWPGDNDHFMGLNLHYLHPYHRMILLTKLMQFASNSRLDDTTRLRFSWQLISNAAKFRIVQPCVKMYLWTHVKSQFIDIPSNEWHTALMLPVARFVGATTTRVWADSARKAKVA